MKAEYDKEIDSLLRERARRGRGVFVEGGERASRGAPSAAHLDADEQGAYAENALPAAARAHYAAHLADCDDCRRSVTQLALAAGMAARLESPETATGRTASPNATWRERLGALFAPRAWRYAVPALALLLVGAVSLVVLTRREQRGHVVAERNTANAERPQATQQPQQPDAHHAQQNDNTATTNASGGENAGVAPGASASASNPDTFSSKEEIAANSGRPVDTQPLAGVTVNNAAPVVAPPPPASSSAGAGSNAREIAALPTPMPVPEVASEAVTITSNDEAKVKSTVPARELRTPERRTGDVDNRQYENRGRDQVSGPQRNARNEQARNNARTADSDEPRNRADKQDENIAATTAAPAPSAAAAARRSRQSGAARGKDENRAAEDAERMEGGRAASAAETRTVAGRKFRRQGNAWVDTAYNAGQSYTVVRRNSEQFRALAADEPELRRIAVALGGEVTVVWKGRAYRFR